MMNQIFKSREEGWGSPYSILFAIALAMGIMLVVLFSGCQERPSSEKPAANSAKLESEAQNPAGDDLVLRMLVWDGYAPEAYVADFENYVKDTYGKNVNLEISYTKGGDDDFFDPIRSRSVDVMTISHHLFKDERFNYLSKEMLLPLDLENIPNQKNILPELQELEYLSSGGRKFGVPVCRGRYDLAYNKDLLDEPPQSWTVFWEPAYRGKYTIAANEYLYNINIVALAMGYPVDSISNYDTLNNPEFKLKLRQLTEGAHGFWVGQDKPEDLSGLYLGAVWGDSILKLERQGEKWGTVVPEEGSPFWIDNYALTWSLADKPFLKKIAEEWIDKLLKPSYQIDYVVRELNQIPVISTLGKGLTATEKTRLHIGDPTRLKERAIPQRAVSQRDRNGLKLIWEEAMEGIEVR